jgi:hypothetical protein
MAQECVPGARDREALENTEVIYDETCMCPFLYLFRVCVVELTPSDQTPERLKILFDWNFDLQDFCHPEAALFGAAEVPLS